MGTGGLSDAALAHLHDLARADPASAAPVRYQPLEEIGRGGMGTVYRARDLLLGRDVALKVLHPGIVSNPEGWLLREARALARLEHPGVVPVHDAGVLPDGRVFYAMRLALGAPLDAWLSERRSLGEVLRLFVRVCDAVAYAHAQGVVHRDLKPSNVMVGAFGDVLVLDWGIAKVVYPVATDREFPRPTAGRPTEVPNGPPWMTVSTAATAPGMVLGTPGYMAPEIASGDAASSDMRGDVYSLGVVLFDCVTTAERDRVPRPVSSIIAKATAARAGDRYASVAELGEDVRRFLDRLPVQAHSEGVWERMQRLADRHRVALALIGVYVIARLVLLVLAEGR